MERLTSAPNNITHFACRLWKSNKFCLIQTFFLNACLRSAFDDTLLQQNLWCGSIFLMILSGLLHLLQRTLRPGRKKAKHFEEAFENGCQNVPLQYLVFPHLIHLFELSYVHFLP